MALLHNQRESDGDASVNFHASYKSRPRVEFQLASASSKLEGQRGVQSSSVLDPQPLPVPTTFDTLYDPSHPDADWAGFVPRDATTKRAFSGHASQRSGLEQTEDGIISRQEKQEWAHRRRADASTISSVVRNGNPGIIGGISTENRWETENQRFAPPRSVWVRDITVTQTDLYIKN